MRIYQPTAWEKFSLWAELSEVQLTFELITYYLVCCLFGFVSGLVIGTRMMVLLSKLT